MLLRRSQVVFITLLLAACGKSPPPPASPATASSAASAVLVTQPAALVTQPAGHIPSQTILRRWKVPGAGEATAYADLGALFRTELIHGLVANGLAALRGTVSPQAAQCVTQWMSSAREAILWGRGSDGLVVIAFDPSSLKTSVDTCIQTLGGLPRAQVTGAKDAYALDKDVMVVLPDTVIIATRSLVEASLSNSGRSEWPMQVALGPEQQLAFIGNDKKEKLELKGDLSVTARRFSARTEIAFPDVATAKAAADNVSPAKLAQELSAVSPEARDLAILVEDCWHVQQDGRVVRFEFATNGDMKAIAGRLGMAAAMGISGVRRYLADAKKAEAYETVGRIAKDIVASVTSKNPQPMKLSSLPAVPAQFEQVQGKKYHSTAADWAKWGRIKFSMADPQYYQYRVEAAKDGKSAEVIAEGDLDGNGKKSRFSLTVRFDPKTHEFVVDPSIKERDPLE
jgi:hypothetical protein